MLSQDDYVLTELLGRDSPEVKTLLAAVAANPDFAPAVHEMLRSLARQRGYDPDNPPPFALPRDMSKSDYIIGTAMSGEVKGEEVGPADADLPAHIGIFGLTAVGKTTLVQLLLLAFAEKLTGKRKHTFCVLDAHDEYRRLLPLFDPDELVWLSANELGLNPFEVPIGEDGQPVMAPDVWLNNLREWFRLLWLNEPSLNLLCEVVREEYVKRGLLEETHE